MSSEDTVKNEPGAEETLVPETIPDPSENPESLELEEQEQQERQQEQDDINEDEDERKPVPIDNEQDLETESKYAEREADGEIQRDDLGDVEVNEDAVIDKEREEHEENNDDNEDENDEANREDQGNQEDQELGEVNEDEEELSEVDEDAGDDAEDDDDRILGLSRHKKKSEEAEDNSEATSASKGGARRALRDYSGEPEQRTESYTINETDDPALKRQLLEKRLAEALKSGNRAPRRKKVGDIDLEQMQDSQIQNLKTQMQDAAYDDAKCINEKSGIALSKLKLLPKVKEVLLRKNLADSILDNNLLESVRVWLEPLPDGSLPAYEIQKVVFNSLLDLPIKTIHLRESGLGKVILFYQKSKRVEPGLKRIADKLVGNWTRPILNLSDNYHDKYVQQESFDILQLMESRKRKKTTTVTERTLYEETAARRKRAAAPQARATAYKIAPKVSLDPKNMTSQARLAAAGIGSSLNRDDQYKRLNSKLQNRGKRVGAKKATVSIEGRDLHM